MATGNHSTVSAGVKRPSCSHATLVRTADGLQLTLPPVGLARAGHGLFWVGICFGAGVALMSVLWVLIAGTGSTHKGVYTPPDPKGAPIPWQMWAGLAGFAMVSLALALCGLSMAVRSGVIEVAGDSLTLREKGLFRSRTLQWNRQELKAIESGPSGMSVGPRRRTGRSGAGGYSIYQLHIYLSNGLRIRLLTGRHEKELDWIAAQLRGALRVGRTKYAGD